MSGGGATKANEEYFTAHPWSGDNASHEDWEKCLTLKALAIGGDLMYQWAERFTSRAAIVTATTLPGRSVTQACRIRGAKAHGSSA